MAFDRIPCGADGSLRMEEAEKRAAETKAVVMLHGSNVCGTLMPAEEMGAFCRRHGLVFILDTAQTAGTFPIDMEAMHIDALAFTGHKGLLGPQGIGGFLLRPELVGRIEPLLSGGTGSVSHLEEVPAFMPDRFEAGTLNLPGVMDCTRRWCGWSSRAWTTSARHELALTGRFLEGLRDIPKLRAVGRDGVEGRAAVVSVAARAWTPPFWRMRWDGSTAC